MRVLLLKNISIVGKTLKRDDIVNALSKSLCTPKLRTRTCDICNGYSYDFAVPDDCHYVSRSVAYCGIVCVEFEELVK